MKNNLKILFLLFSLLLLFNSCSKDNFNEINNENQLKIRKISKLEIEANFKLFSKLLQIDNTKENIQGKIVNDSVYNFSINTNFATFIDNGVFSTYTFEVFRNSSDNKLENLILKSNNQGGYDCVLIKYDFTKTALEQDDFNPSLYNAPIYTIINFDYNSALSAKCEGSSGTLECGEYWSYVCDGTPDQGELTGNTNFEENCDWIVSTGNCTMIIDEECAGGSDIGGGIISSPTHGGGGGGSELENLDSILTPCSQLKKKTSDDPNYMTHFNGLNVQSSFTFPNESGYIEKKVSGVSQYQYLYAAGNAALSFPPGTLNFTHVHNNKPKTSNGIQYDGAVKMFSPADLSILMSTCQTANTNAGLDVTEAFGIMISNEGIFAITLLEPISSAEIPLITQKWGKFSEDYEQDAKDVIEDYTLSPTERKEAMEKMFLKGLKTLGIENKIGVFEGKVTNVNGINNLKWTRKTLNGNTVTKSPC